MSRVARCVLLSPLPSVQGVQIGDDGTVLQVIASGMLNGGVYGMIALGLSLVFGVARVINFAHGILVMLGMFCSYFLWASLGWSPTASLPLVIVVLFAVGFLVQSTMINPVLRKEIGEPIGLLLLTCGIGIILENLILATFGPDFRTIVVSEVPRVFRVGGVTLSIPRVKAFALALLVAVGLHLYLRRSRQGKALRATAQDRNAAQLCGVNIFRMYSTAMGIGAATAGVAGAVLSEYYYIFPAVGSLFTLKSFVIVVIGGLGSIPGAFLGGLVIGLIEALGGRFLPISFVEVITFTMFVVVVIARPSGLFGVQRS